MVVQERAGLGVHGLQCNPQATKTDIRIRGGASIHVNGSKGRAMIWIIEIENAKGNKATKECYGYSMQEVVEGMEFELIDYPEWRLSRIWPKREETPMRVRGH
jgi:hypothetical protein